MPYDRTRRRATHYKNHEECTIKQTTKATIDKDTLFSRETQRIHQNDIKRL